ncbi:type II toxin-antitoxin system RelE/ParE family toxin [Roseicella aquatilis]|uniref:Type II toxin-antitoxin system RelE/ParE family toxin n=1 Tax=Roseicella aquatilis TaxID=2527868 RepID=A0A4R4D809_9PROT|nr:type II toxin-antitoxin system RelE/ParE family toxin [Roseicella aquatilis]TCZ55965.1 type II toxin-antitoxin system RelE/ParE family toxin [Roseicella aquatilis]
MSGAAGRPARLTAAARRDLREAMAWIQQDNPAAARRLRDAVQRAAERIGDFPRSGALRPEFLPPGRRLLVLAGLPYVLVYSEATQPPTILRLLHAARDLPDVLRRDLPG